MIALELRSNLSVKGDRGFSLIELLVTLAIVGMMMSAVYAVHISTIRAVDIEEERVEIQQDQRFSLDFIARQLRMAGYNKSEFNGANKPQIVDAGSNYIYFTSDLNEDGDIDDNISTPADTGEHIAFCVYNSAEFGLMLSYITGASDIGVAAPADPLPPVHAHNSGGTHSPFAPIEAIEFFYSYYDSLTDSILQTRTPNVTQREELRSVAVTILARADTPDPRWRDNEIYVPPSGTAFNGGIPYGDNTRRRMMTANIRFRNLGL